MKAVNKLGWIYVFVVTLGISVFAGVFLLFPGDVRIERMNTDETDKTPHVIAEENREGGVEISEELPKETYLVFTGDIMMARAVEWTMKEKGSAYPFAKWDTSLFKGADAVIGNFESTIREKENIEKADVLNFDTLPQYISSLKDTGFTHLSLANNHADDFGQTTTDFTRANIAANNLTPFGDPFAGKTFITHLDGDIPITLIGFHAFGEPPTGIIETITAESAAGNFVIIFPHWGNEYQHTPSIAQTSAAQIWINAGADLIIGAHPHVVQRVEMIDDVPVVYSLGNFLFDQDFSEDTKTGAIVNVNIKEDADEVSPTLDPLLTSPLERGRKFLTLSFAPVRITNRQMTIDHEYDDELSAWLNLSSLTMTIPLATDQIP